MGTTDKRPDGVDTIPADAHDLDSYRQAQDALARLQLPVLLHAGNPHERLYVAGLDGTGNSMFKDDPANWSVVAKIHSQVDALRKQGVTNIAGGYVEGTFTQDNPVTRNVDGFSGYTFERRVETAYHQFCKQAYEWLKEDPNAQIRVAGVGFSRGSEEVAALTRMIEERGIQDPTDAKLIYDKHDLITHAQYTRAPLVPPGQTLQAALLYDPVATGVSEHDRRLPPSVMSALQITAEDERRNLFKSNELLPPGLSEGDRFGNVTVGGSHSDIGDTYRLNGLGVRSFNLGVGYLNGMSDTPFLRERQVPQDPAHSVVHRSDQHLHGLYRTSSYDDDGVRDHRRDEAPASQCRTTVPVDCERKQPIDPALDAPLERRGAPTQTLEPQAAARSTSPSDDAIDRLYAAAMGGDANAWRQTSQSVAGQYLASPQGQAWQGEVRGLEQTQAQERQATLDMAQQLAAQQAVQQNPHVMRM